MNEELSPTLLAELIAVYRVSQRRPDTVSLKCEIQPSLAVSTHVHKLFALGYLKEWEIEHPRYSWQFGVSEKGLVAIADTTLPKVILDLGDDRDLRAISSLISLATREELPMLLAHSNYTVRHWACLKLSALDGRITLT